MRIGVALGLLGIACESPTGPDLSSDQVPNVTTYVTSDVALFLNSEGHFVNDWTCPGSSNDVLAPREAEELAVVFARRYLSGTVGIGDSPPAGLELSQAHGHAIEWSRVTAGMRPSPCAGSVLAPMPSDFHQATLNHYGPYYLAPLYVEDDQVALVAVAANSEVYVNADGRVEGRSGNEFRWAASPHGHAFGNPLSPEAAVMIAAEQTGGLAADLPTLLAPGHNVDAHHARWEIRLDRVFEATRDSDGSPIHRDVIYVGYSPSFVDFIPGEPWSPRLFVAAPDQPTEQVVSVLDEDHSWKAISWPIRDGVPTDFWEVSFDG